MKIFLEPGNPQVTSRNDLEPLIGAIKRAIPESTVEYREKSQRGFAVAWWEVLRIYVAEPLEKAALGILIKQLIKIAEDWARTRFDTNTRPRYVCIYGPNEEVLKEILLKERDGSILDPAEEMRRANKTG